MWGGGEGTAGAGKEGLRKGVEGVEKGSRDGIGGKARVSGSLNYRLNLDRF